MQGEASADEKGRHSCDDYDDKERDVQAVVRDASAAAPRFVL
jgi:hypothetical protein